MAPPFLFALLCLKHNVRGDLKITLDVPCICHCTTIVSRITIKQYTIPMKYNSLLWLPVDPPLFVALLFWNIMLKLENESVLVLQFIPNETFDLAEACIAPSKPALLFFNETVTQKYTDDRNSCMAPPYLAASLFSKYTQLLLLSERMPLMSSTMRCDLIIVSLRDITLLDSVIIELSQLIAPPDSRLKNIP